MTPNPQEINERLYYYTLMHESRIQRRGDMYDPRVVAMAEYRRTC